VKKAIGGYIKGRREYNHHIISMILAFSWSCTIFIASATRKKPWTNLSQPQVVPDKV